MPEAHSTSIEPVHATARPFRPPGALNVLLLIAASLAAGGCLHLASHAGPWWMIGAAAVAFSFLNNTLFSLLHESVHGMFHRRRWINEWAGRIAAGFFPTGLGFQRVFHLRHHRHNRTEVERFDYLQPGESKWLKWLQWYGILSGLYWITAPLGALIYLVWPGFYALKPFRGQDTALVRQTAMDAMFEGFDHARPAVLRGEILLSLGVQVVLIWLSGATVAGWWLCYAAFAINWSSLQYADHAFSELHVTEGAWNLRVPRPVRWLFLNYHHHKAHHQHPEVPWLHLGGLVDPRENQPSFFRIWLDMWRGPRPLPVAARTSPSAKP